MLLLDSSRIDVMPLAGRSFHYKPLATTGDRESGQVIGEYTLECATKTRTGESGDSRSCALSAHAPAPARHAQARFITFTPGQSVLAPPPAVSVSSDSENRRGRPDSAAYPLCPRREGFETRTQIRTGGPCHELLY